MIDKSKFVNHFDLSQEALETIRGDWSGNVNIEALQPMPETLLFRNLLPPEIVNVLKNELARNSWLAVGLDGKANHTYNEIGNYRLSSYNEELAQHIWQRLSVYPMIDVPLLCDAFTPTDAGVQGSGSVAWRAVGVSPLFRFIRYTEGGKLVAHYDETFIQDEDHRTLISLVIYLTQNQDGATRFLKDTQVGKPLSEYDFSDWDRVGNEDEVLERSPPVVGTGLYFPHRILHDSEPLKDGDPEKIIIRTDIMFEKA